MPLDEQAAREGLADGARRHPFRKSHTQAKTRFEEGMTAGGGGRPHGARACEPRQYSRYARQTPTSAYTPAPSIISHTIAPTPPAPHMRVVATSVIAISAQAAYRIPRWRSSSPKIVSRFSM